MSVYGQFCPIAKATEVLGERWTLLILREMLLGSSRFSQLQAGLSRCSPALLTKRLKELEQANLIVKVKINGQRGFEYHLAPSGKKLAPLMQELATWGMSWVQSGIADDELDLELLMVDIQRNLNAELLPDRQTTLKFHFTDSEELSDWWIVASPNSVDLCTQDPGSEPDCYLTSNQRTLIEIWMGNQSWRSAQANKDITIVGSRAVVNQVPAWIGVSNATSLVS